MSIQSLNQELTTKVLFLANLHRNLLHNQHMLNEKTIERNNVVSTETEQQQLIHPLLMPSSNVSSQKISAMLSALTPSSPNTMPIQSKTSSSSLITSNNNAMNSRMAHASGNIRPSGSSFGWGNRERKMEENWRMQNRKI